MYSMRSMHYSPLAKLCKNSKWTIFILEVLNYKLKLMYSNVGPIYQLF